MSSNRSEAAKKAAITRKRNKIEKTMTQRLLAAHKATEALSDAFCDSADWTPTAGLAKDMVVALDQVFAIVREIAATRGAQILTSEEIDSLLDLRNAATTIQRAQYATSDVCDDDVEAERVNLIHTGERLTDYLYRDFDRRVYSRRIDPNTAELIANNID